MSRKKQNGVVLVLWSTIAGTISLFVSALLVAMLMVRVDIVILDTILAGGIGGLLLGIFLHQHHKIGKMALAGTLAVPAGFWGAFMLAGGVDFLYSLIYVNSENPNVSGIANVIAIMFMGLLCDAIFGAILYGRKSIGLFSAVGGLISLPFYNDPQVVDTKLENIVMMEA